MTPIIVGKNGLPILLPQQYITLLDAVRDERLKATIEILFHSGLRYQELQQINAESYDTRSGKLHIMSGKGTAKLGDRWIPLTPTGKAAVEKWIGAVWQPMSRSAYNEAVGKITRPRGFHVSAKASRKTYESWRILLGDDYMRVCINIGHTPNTMYKHYLQELPVTEEDIALIRKIFGRD